MGNDAAIYEFGPFRLDTAQHALYRDLVETPLPPKLFDLLLLLVEAGGATLDKDLLLSKVWPDAIVEEGSLTRSISRLRTVLGEPAGSETYIRTVARRGYRFVADVRRVDPIVAGPETAPAAPAATAPEAPPAPAARRRLNPWVGAAILGFIVVVAAVANWPSRPTPAAVNHPRSIAILPFQSVTGDDALGIGLADSLITRLANQDRVTVRPTSAVTRFAGGSTDSAAAGRALSVDAVLEGTVRRVDGQHRVSARLISVSDGSQLWGSTFDETSPSLLTVEDRLAAKLAEALAIALDSLARPGRRGTTNTEAYEAYLRGRFMVIRLTREAFDEAQRNLTRAIALDPGFAQAYEAQAYLHVNTVDLIAPPKQAYPAAIAAVARALEIDPSLPEAHTTLALIRWQYDWDFAAAEREFTRAIELDPAGAFARSQYAFFLGAMGRADASVAEAARARAIDPLSSDIGLAEATALYWARQYAAAADRAAAVSTVDAQSWLAMVIRGRALEARGSIDQAIAIFEKASRMDGAVPEALMDLGRAYARAGQRPQAQRALADLRALGTQAYSAPFQAAVIYAALGEKDRAFDQLEQAFAARSWYMTWLTVDPSLDPLRSDPRFAALVKRVGFTR